MKNKVSAVILAGGDGKRMGEAVAKQFLKIDGVSVIERSVDAFSRCELVDEIVLVIRPGDDAAVNPIAKKYSKVRKLCYGGAYRAESAKNGYYCCSADSDVVAIHDAARCLITPEMITKVIEKAQKKGAATAASRLYDTVKRADSEGKIYETVNRDGLWCAATPQAFSYELYGRALEKCFDTGLTDDNMLVERLGVSVFCVDTGKTNIKITEKEDVALAEFILRKRKEVTV